MINAADANTGVLVTGGSGYVAGWMIIGLLRRGFRVRTTLRSLDKEAKLRADVAAQVEADHRLSVCVADLTRDEGWDAAVRDCEFVLHVASPMGQGLPRSADLLGPARDGSLRVLGAAARCGVRRVVVTSSVVAASPPPGTVGATNETVWTDLSSSGVDNYARAKTSAERAVWEFAANTPASSGLTLATILPGMILGPVMSNSVSGSVEVISRLLAGKVPAIPNIGFAIVDVRDLVDLHIAAMLAPAAAHQRFIASHDYLWLSEIAALLREQYGARAKRVPTRAMPDLVVRIAALVQQDARFIAPKLGIKREFSAAKAMSLLGWHPRSAQESVRDAAESLFAYGLL